MNNKTGKDLTKEAPRSPKAMAGGFYILGRTIDKCRALLWGDIGEYEFDCELDRSLFGFKGITGDDFKSHVSEGHSDEAIAQWVKKHGDAKTDSEIAAWNEEALNEDYSDDQEGKSWLQGKIKMLGLRESATIFDYLEADDLASFRQ